MKFHFIGGLDCPDWILAEVSSLSKLPVLKFKNWCSNCVEHLISGRNDWDDAELTLINAEKILDDESLKAMLAALMFILEKTTKSACSAHDLELEMQQLGFPAAPSLALSSMDAKEGAAGKVYIINMHTSSNENISIALNNAKLNYLVQELTQALDVIRPYVRSDASGAH